MKTKKQKSKQTLASYNAEVTRLNADDEASRRAEKFPPPLQYDRLMNCSLLMPPCGCTVEGRGTTPQPVRIVFCEMHRGEGPLGDLLDRLRNVHPDDLAPSLRDIRAAWVKAGCPGHRDE